MKEQTGEEPCPGGNGHAVVIGVFMAVEILIHLLTAARYGFFRDELYYGEHDRWPVETVFLSRLDDPRDQPERAVQAGLRSSS